MIDIDPQIKEISEKREIPASSLEDALGSLIDFLDPPSNTTTKRVRIFSDHQFTTLDQYSNILDRNFGLKTEFVSHTPFDQLAFPCCITLKEGGYAVAIDRKNDLLTLNAPDSQGGTIAVPADIVAQAFAGEALFASRSIEDIERRYLPSAPQAHWFWGRLKAEKSIIRDIALASLMANLLAVSVSLFVLQVYDRVIPHQSLVTLWVLVAGVALAIALEAALRIARAHLMDAAGRKLEINLSGFLFERFLGARLSTLKMSPGASVSNLREFGSIREFFTAASIGSVADIPFVLIFLLLIYAIAGNIVFIIIAAMGAIILPSLWAKSKMARLSEDTLGATAASNRILIETAYSKSSVKSHQAEGLFERKWAEVTTLGAIRTTKQRALAAGLTFSAQSIQQTAYILAVVAGVYMVFAGDLTVGAIIAIGILSSRSLSPITQLAGTLARWQQVAASLEALDHIAESPQERPRDRHFARYEIPEGEIVIEDLIFQYREDTAPCLNIRNLTIKPGEKIAILGENGSGKSTLLALLTGLYDFTNGAVSLDGRDLRQIDPDDLRQHIGYLPQHVHLFSGTLRDNLTHGKKTYSEQDIIAALTFAGLEKFLKTHPLGLDMEILDGGEGVSMGQRQSIGLARLYLENPAIILLDEPTASLDQTLAGHITARLEQWLEGKTCLITTHRTGILPLTPRIIILKNGAIAMDGPREEVIRKLTPEAPLPSERQNAPAHKPVRVA